MKLLSNRYSSNVNFRVLPGSTVNPVVFTIELSPEFPIHNITEKIVLLIKNYEEFDEAPLKQLVEVIPVGKSVVLWELVVYSSIYTFISDTCICEPKDEDSPNDASNILVITERVCIGTALSPCTCSKNGCKVH